MVCMPFIISETDFSHVGFIMAKLNQHFFLYFSLPTNRNKQKSRIVIPLWRLHVYEQRFELLNISTIIKTTTETGKRRRRRRSSDHGKDNWISWYTWGPILTKRKYSTKIMMNNNSISCAWNECCIFSNNNNNITNSLSLLVELRTFSYYFASSLVYIENHRDDFFPVQMN